MPYYPHFYSGLGNEAAGQKMGTTVIVIKSPHLEGPNWLSHIHIAQNLSTIHIEVPPDCYPLY